MIYGQDSAELNLSHLKAISALGQGAKGVVFLVKNRINGELMALKVICKARIESRKCSTENVDEYKRIWFEKEVLKSFNHPLLPRLKGIVTTDKIVGYGIDFCSGGNLDWLRKKQMENIFSHDIIRFYAAELVLALEYLHGFGIVYRDLKPENVMIQRSGHLMLVDFDLSIKLSPKSPHVSQVRTPKPKPPPTKINKLKISFSIRFCNSGITPEFESERVNSARISESDLVGKSNSFVGTEEYVAPEIVSGAGHNFAVDWWSLGVVLYEMLYGRTPFKGFNRKETFYRILTKTPELVGEPAPLRDLIRKLLEKDPTARISLAEIKGHDFFAGVDWDSIVRLPRPPYIPMESEEDEDMSEKKEIDVEKFVHEVFKIGNEDKVEKKYRDSQSRKDQDFVNATITNLSPNDFSKLYQVRFSKLEKVETSL